MQTKRLGFLALFVAITTSLWVVLLIWMTATGGSVDVLPERIAAIEKQYGIWLVNYANAGLITLFTAAFLGGLYAYLKSEDAFWAAIGLVFIPVYAVLNLVVYLSQIFVVPVLLELYADPETYSMSELLLRMVIHDWPGSAAAFANALAYAMLGIPSIIFGNLLAHREAGLRIPGLLLAVSGGLSWISLAGVAAGSSLLARLTLVSGFVFLIALFWLGTSFLRGSPRSGNP